MSISTQPYKGVRDFYPEDKRIQNYIFDVWKMSCESFGYQEYDASILEPAELYESKTSEEIVKEQTYTFEDRGGRRVTLRTEMTPTVARLVAQKKREYSLPIRWYSMPNCFRYERPQRGRLREFWQLNADIFGVEGVEAEVEIISLAVSIMDNFGISRDDFDVRINHRAILQSFLQNNLKDPAELPLAMRLLDKYEKDSDAREKLYELLTVTELDLVPNEEVVEVLEKLEARDITNVHFTPTITRGFDYYSGIVFEVFDKNPENNRSIFGGGRYNNLLDIFGEEKIPAVGFGMGDVTIQNALETYGLFPDYVKLSTTDLYITLVSPELHLEAETLAAELREQDLNVVVDLSRKKLGDQIKKADKDRIPFVLIVGTDELESGMFTLKKLSTGDEVKVSRERIAGTIREHA